MQQTKIKIKLVYSSFKKLALGKFLTDNTNLQIAEELIMIFSLVFLCTAMVHELKWRQLIQSFYKHSDIAQNNIIKEVAKVRMAGPFKARPMSTLRVSSLGVVPKKWKANSG